MDGGSRHSLSHCEMYNLKLCHAPRIRVAIRKIPTMARICKRRCDFRKEELHSTDMGDERRRVPRYSAHVKASVKLPGESTALGVMVEDLCVLGCLLEYGQTLEVHEECEFAMGWKGREFRSPALVAWRGVQGQAGLEFHNTDPANQQLLREVCADFLTKPLMRLPQSHE